ncbi:MAG: signal recognition particle protein [Oscillospiraceae bacterium]|nr:signal recognition particle protein [Oscillospiraceae bacterium]
MAFEGLTDKLSAAFKKLRSKGRLTEADVKEAMREIRLALLEADVSYKVVKDFVKKVTERAIGSDVLESLTPAQMIVKIVNEELVALMGSENAKIQISSKPPTVVMLVGLQGAGKTTNGAKLAGLMKKDGKNPLLVACDVYRPAAIKQLEVVGGQLGIPVFQMGTANPVDIAKAAVEHAKRQGNDMVFLDTAGRLHIDETLMEELSAIKEAVNPTEILLVVDAMTGQDAVNAATAFNNQLDIDGVMLTKLDGDARGGAALSVKAVTGKPIKFVGNGEKLDNIEPFHPSRMASRILGMGDVLTLIEKAEQAMDQKKAEELEKKLRSSKFTLQDFYDQMVQIKSMGSLTDILGMMPGVNAGALKNIQVDEKAMAHMEAIILSMTPYERENPGCINHSRKQRISAGAGVKVQEINQLLKSFEEMQKMMKQLSGMGNNKTMQRMARQGGLDLSSLGGMGGKGKGKGKRRGFFR